MTKAAGRQRVHPAEAACAVLFSGAIVLMQYRESNIRVRAHCCMKWYIEFTCYFFQYLILDFLGNFSITIVLWLSESPALDIEVSTL